MAITIKIGEKENPGIKMPFVARTTIDGKIMILDHNDIDILIDPSVKKVTVFPKNNFHDKVYDCQDRLFDFLAKSGVIKRETVHAGDVYASMEGEYPEAINGVNTTQIVMFSIGKFILEEKPQQEMEEEFEREQERELTAPNEDESTNLGDVPHKDKQGSIDRKSNNYMTGYGYY